MRFQQAIEAFPDFRQPADDVVHRGRDLFVGGQLSGDQSAPKQATEKTDHRLHVVGAQHPAEVVVQLEIGRRAGWLVHRSYDVRAALVHHHSTYSFRHARLFINL